MKVRTAQELFDYLDHDLSWRKKELLTFGLMIERGRTHQGEVLRRAGIALLYAHWEGFVKSAGTAYVAFVARQNMTHRELKSNFLALAIKSKLHQATVTSKASLFGEVAAYFVEKLDDRARILWDRSIQTKSNLGSERMREIAATLGLDYRPFELKEKTIIERLRNVRNSIAHGRYLGIAPAEYDQLTQEVLMLMDEYRRQIDQGAQLREYRR